MTMRTCRFCQIEKPYPDAFYAGSGHKCRECVKAAVKLRADQKRPEIQAYDRARGLLDHRKEAGRLYRLSRRKPTIRKPMPPEARQAHILVGNSVRDARLDKPDTCSRCGAGGRIHGHHEDYTKPLEVVWVCAPCHGSIHREINEKRRASAHNLENK